MRPTIRRNRPDAVWSHWLLAIMLSGMLGSCCVPPVTDQTAPVPDLGVFGVQADEVMVIRPDSSTFPAVVYHPIQISKDGVPFARITYPVPTIAFGHGYLASPDLYASTLEHLASHGYIVIATRSGGETFPDHRALADDLLLSLTYMTLQSGDPGSQFYQQVDPNRLAMIGHSMGGGAAILAAADDARVKAVATLACAETDPSAIEAAARMAVPALYLYGTEDSIAPPDQHALAVYANAGQPKLAMGIIGGCHCGFIDEWMSFCDVGSLSRTDQLSLVWDRLTAFLDLYLLELPESRDQLLAPAPELAIQLEPAELPLP